MVSLRNSIIEEARHRLEAVVEDYLDKANQNREEKISRTSCDLVGVHVRRRDHIKYEERLGLDTLTRQYFMEAVDLYRERLKQPIFLIVTDDPDWVRRELPPHHFPQYTTGKYQ